MYQAGEYGAYRKNLDPAFVATHWAVNAAAIPSDAAFAGFRREKNSHRGVGTKTKLKMLRVDAVNQDALVEICELTQLEHLELGYPMTASDLAPLTKLISLKVLKIDSPRNIADFTPLLTLPSLNTLIIENAKHMTDLGWLKPLGGQLRVLGIEGALDSKQKLGNLAPLAGFAFEALFLAAVQLNDKDLTPLVACPNLKYLAPARFAPRKNFEALKALRPDIHCRWFDQWEVKGVGA